MKRDVWYSVVLLLAIGSVPSAEILSTVGVRHTVIAASRDAAPVGGRYLALSFFNARLNARHDVVFDAFVGAPPFTTGVFAHLMAAWCSSPTSATSSGSQFDINENGVLWIGNFGAAKAVVFSRLP